MMKLVLKVTYFRTNGFPSMDLVSNVSCKGYNHNIITHKKYDNWFFYIFLNDKNLSLNQVKVENV